MNQPVMNQPPNVLSTKDTLYITDMLSWNLLAAKQANNFASKVNCQEIQQTMNEVYQMHKKHYDQLLNLLQNNNNS